MAKISIIMPAYNAEKYITNAIDSIITQTFKNWELIICDDCSSDKTVTIVEEYCKKDNRIILIKREQNSGGARIPRKTAALAATAPLIMTFDADDFLDADYIEKLYKRKKEAKANIALSCLSFCNEKGEEQRKYIPCNKFDYSQIMSGEEATKLTLGNLQISVSGLLIDKDIYINNITTSDKSTDNCSYVDEIDQRRLLLQNKTVAFANTKYYYRQQPNSLMHNIGAKRYDFLTSTKVIYKFAKENFTDKDVFRRLENEYLTNLLFCQRDYYLYEHYKLKEKKEIIEKIKNAYKFAKNEKMQPQNRKQKICMQSYTLMKFISWIYGFYLRKKQQ